MMKLQEDWAWTEPRMVKSYLTLGKICIMTMIVNYIASAMSGVYKRGDLK
ncbi:MAG: hypothetical protein R2877_06595 [Bdellovibrionota bacterium]